MIVRVRDRDRDRDSERTVGCKLGKEKNCHLCLSGHGVSLILLATFVARARRPIELGLVESVKIKMKSDRQH